MGRVIAEISIVPLGTADTSLSRFVAGIEKAIRACPQVKSQLTPMATVLEGELDDILKLLREIHEIPFRLGALRVSTRVSIDDRRDKQATMAAKLRAVEEKLS